MAVTLQMASSDVKYQQILVKPENGQLQVTFDDNKNSNYWSYHQGTNSPHITELFHLESAGGLNVKIFGYLPPHNVRWYLSVSENPSGVIERFPKFRAQQEVEENDNLHTVFTTDVDAISGLAALSFKTDRDSRTVYFAPSDNILKRIKTQMTEDPEYVFEFGETYTEKQLLSFGIGWETICEDPE